MRRKIIEVTSADLVDARWRRRTHSVTYRRAEEARRRAEELRELERTGELERRKKAEDALALRGEIERLNGELRFGSYPSDPVLERILSTPLPTETVAIALWIQGAEVIRRAAEEELVRRREAERRWKEEEKVLRRATLLVEMAEVLRVLDCGAIPVVSDFLRFGRHSLLDEGIITKEQGDRISEAQQYSYCYSYFPAEIATWSELREARRSRPLQLHEIGAFDPVSPPWEERFAHFHLLYCDAKYLSLSHRPGRRKRHRQGYDPDRRREWRREKRRAE